MAQNESKEADFLVCGLGNLGQSCVSILKEFGARVNAIELTEIEHWEILHLPELIDFLVVGDCRQPKMLEIAGIRSCRAILLVTSNEQVNIAGAFAARSLNPNVRLVIRSAQINLNEILSQSLGNFVAFEPTQLPAKSFALAALGSETRGFFSLDNRLLRVVRVKIDSTHRWCDRASLFELNNSQRRVLIHGRAAKPLPRPFYHWESEAKVLAGDTIAYIETTENHPQALNRTRISSPWFATEIKWQDLGHLFKEFWQEGRQSQRVAIVCGIVMLSLFICGMVLYKLEYPDISLQDAINVSLVLSIGGYDNMFGQLKLPFAIPWWLHLFSISLTVAGTVFIGILYALLTERVLAARFQFVRRPPVPKSGHVVLIGLGRLGQGVAKLLQDMQQPLVVINATAAEPGILPQMPLIIGNIKDALNKVNITTAKSIIAVSDDEIANLEIALLAHAANPKVDLVIRTFDPRFSENIARLLPYARVLGVYALAAEAFAAAAFGENVLSLFRLNNQTTLVVEYQITLEDTLNGRLLAEIAFGYGVVPILHARDQETKLMPSDDIQLQVGDRLVVLATIDGLQRVENGITTHRHWLVRVEKALTEAGKFTAVAIITRVSGCDLKTAKTLMNHIPGTLELPLYKHQAQRLVVELGKVQVMASLVNSQA